MVASFNSPTLTIQTPKGVEKLELVAQDTLTFGRSPKNKVQLEDPFASRYHAKLNVNRFQHCYVVDLSSRNGTLLNDEPLTAPAWLKHGDRICIGETIISFEDGREDSLELAPEEADISVLMVLECIPQGKIWQEIFTSLNISMRWNESSTTIKQTLEERAAFDLLPKMLLMDVSSFSNAHHFCRWCHQTFPQVKIFLLDSTRREIPSIERQIALKNGASNFFPAMNRHNLVLRSTERLRDINEVLSVLEGKTLRQEELLSILRRMTLQK
jgi:pSer/pThr/pTyr-binding forkhead associated (FHA) protein